MDDRLLCAMFRMKKLGSSFPFACDIQYGELSVMRRVIEDCPAEGKNLNVVEIQQTLHISKPAVSQILNSLERKGYILRSIDPQDRRKISVSPTQEGAATLQEATAQYERAMQELLQRFGEDNLNALVRQLEALMQVYDELRDEWQNGLME